MEKQHQRKTPDLSRLAEPGKSAPRVPEEKAAEEISFESIGGKKVGHPVSEKSAAKEFIVENVGGKKVSSPVPEKEVRFDHLGAKVIRRSPYFLHLPDPTDAPAESEEDEGDTE
jgi:hypothetical protein